MIQCSRRCLLRMWVNDLLLIFRASGGLPFWIPILLVGYYLIKSLNFFPLTSFLVFLVFLEHLFSNMLHRYPQELRHYVACGVSLKCVLLGKNLSLFSLGACGAILCGFGFQWRSSVTWQDSISVLLYFGITIFLLLIVFNYVAVFRRFFRTGLRRYLLYFVMIWIASVPYLIGWVYLRSYGLCLLVSLAGAICCYFVISRHIAPLAHCKIIELLEVQK